MNTAGTLQCPSSKRAPAGAFVSLHQDFGTLYLRISKPEQCPRSLTLTRKLNPKNCVPLRGTSKNGSWMEVFHSDDFISVINH